MAQKKIPFYNRILFRLLLPVVIVGIACSTMLVSYMSSPIKEFLARQFDANLRLASIMGLETCENSFNYLLELRLEKSSEMNETMQNEAIEKIRSISKQFPHINLMVLESGKTIKASSINGLPKKWKGPLVIGKDDTGLGFTFLGKRVRSHVQFFPFWNWHIISFVFEKDYESPIRMAYTVTYLSALFVFISVLGTLIVMFYLFIKRPLNQLVDATEGVSEGRLHKITRIAANEFGRLMTSYNSMIDSLDNERAEGRSLIHQLEESEALFRSQFEFGNIGIAITTVDEKLIRANERLCHILGYSEEELGGKAWSEIANPKDLRASTISYRRMLAGEIESYEMDMRLFRKKGNVIFTHLNISCYRNQDRSVQFIIISILDITNRKKAEEALQKSEEYLRSLFRAAPTGIGVVVDRVIDQVNEKLCMITGYSEDEMIGKKSRILYPNDEEFEYVGREKYDQIRKYGTGTVETRWERKDGHIIDVLLSSTPMDLNDFSKGVTFTALDISDRKRAEAALREANHMLRLVLDTIPVRVFWKDRES
jgi:PAS domain S-box-containing protein